MHGLARGLHRQRNRLHIVVAHFAANHQIAGLQVGPDAPDDEFVHSARRAGAIEMEGAAVAQVCYQQGVPCLIIRSLSDRADSHAVVDLPAFLTTAARNSALVVKTLVDSL